MLPSSAMAVLIETTRAIFNNRRRVKLVLKDIEFIRCNGYTKIYSTISAFAAIKTDGSIKAWEADSVE
jgi:hypothetical protein